MLKVGLTGGIGSGKSFVADLFKHLGIPIFNADLRAKKSMREDPLVKKALIEAFGPMTFESSELNTAYLAEIVFTDSAALAKLNGIVHPAVRKDFLSWHKVQDAPYTIREAAILFESGAHVDCDFVIAVNAPLELRIQRVIDRDHSNREKVLDRMKNQWTDEQRTAKASFIINNDEQEMLLPQVVKIHQALLNKIKDAAV